MNHHCAGTELCPHLQTLVDVVRLASFPAGAGLLAVEIQAVGGAHAGLESIPPVLSGLRLARSAWRQRTLALFLLPI